MLKRLRLKVACRREPPFLYSAKDLLQIALVQKYLAWNTQANALLHPQIRILQYKQTSSLSLRFKTIGRLINPFVPRAYGLHTQKPSWHFQRCKECVRIPAQTKRVKSLYMQKMTTLINNNYILLLFLYICNASWQIVQQTLMESSGTQKM